MPERRVAFRGLNWWHYGKFVGVDFKEANFQNALRAIHSVRSGGIKPFIPVTSATRREIYRVSPTFASLESYFDLPDKPVRSGWVEMTCETVPESCGEIAAGWFMWALRDAASQRGHYASPARVSAFFGQVAYEISSACARGELECQPQALAELPPTDWREVWERVPSRLARMWQLLVVTQWPQQLNRSAGTDRQLAEAARFLNYPYYVVAAAASDFTGYSIRGWYHKSAKQWLSVTARTADGTPQDIELKRLPSPELRGVLNDPSADEQRLSIRLRCSDDCVLKFVAEDGAELEKSLAELQRGVTGFRFGGGLLAIESGEKDFNPLTEPTRVERVAERIRVKLIAFYPWVFLPVCALGLLAFLAATLFCPRRAFLKVTYVLALSSWILVFLRTLLLGLIDATSFPALQLFYIYPAHFMAVTGAVLSLAALLELSGYAPVPVWRRKTVSQQ